MKRFVLLLAVLTGIGLFFYFVMTPSITKLVPLPPTRVTTPQPVKVQASPQVVPTATQNARPTITILVKVGQSFRWENSYGKELRTFRVDRVNPPRLTGGLPPISIEPYRNLENEWQVVDSQVDTTLFWMRSAPDGLVIIVPDDGHNTLTLLREPI